MADSVQTMWSVITGAPCSGKTTIVNKIQSEGGFRTNPDITRLYIEEKIKAGKDKYEVRADYIGFLRETLNKKLENAGSLPTNELVVHDYGIPEHLAFARCMGIYPDKTMREDCSRFVYNQVILFSPLKVKEDLWEEDSVRDETSELQNQLDRTIELVYKELGYRIVRVPVLSVCERYDLVMKYLHMAPQPEWLSSSI